MAVDHVPAIVLDALEEDLDSTTVASSRVVLAQNSVVQEESGTMPVEVRFGALNDRVGVPVVQMADTDSDILSDTVTDLDSSGNVVRQESAESSDFDSVQGRTRRPVGNGDVFTNKHGLNCLSRSQCLSLLFYFCLS